MLCLVVSGGHTDLIYLPAHGQFQLLGRTLDDAAGEAFDKVARALGLPYPGGPEIDRQSQNGDCTAYSLPRAWLEEGSLDFSFSGLKSAVLNVLHQAKQVGENISVPDLAASFQAAVVDVLVQKTLAAAKRMEVRSVYVAGGVSANRALRERLRAAAEQAGLQVGFPPLELCTDNAAMIASAGFFRWQAGVLADLHLNAVPQLPLQPWSVCEQAVDNH
jgi:N6-L-threonylcarbamoyladenine synthase